MSLQRRSPELRPRYPDYVRPVQLGGVDVTALVNRNAKAELTLFDPNQREPCEKDTRMTSGSELTRQTCWLGFHGFAFVPSAQ